MRLSHLTLLVSIPNLIKSILPCREGRIAMKFRIHLQAFVGQEPALGEHLRGDTLQNGQLCRNIDLQREAVVHGPVGLAVTLIHTVRVIARHHRHRAWGSFSLSSASAPEDFGGGRNIVPSSRRASPPLHGHAASTR